MSDEEIKMRVTVEDQATKPLNGVADAEREVVKEQENASRAARSGASAAASLQERLVELIKQENQHQASLRLGVQADHEALVESQKRQSQIEHLATTLHGQHQAEQAAAEQSRAAAAATREAGDAAASTGSKSGLASKLLDGFGDAAAGMASKWVAFTAISGAIITAINQIGQAARQSFSAVADLGKAVGDLAGNVGGKTADKMKRKADEVARVEGLGPEGRTELLKSLGAITDKREMTPQQMEEYLGLSAKMQAATGVGGEQQARLMHSAMSRLGKSAPEAAGMLTTMLANGADAGSLAPLLDRVGAAGGEDMLGMVYAANKSGLDMNEATRGTTSIIDAMSRTDERGRLDPKLRRQGLTEQMSPTERFRTLAMQYSTGQLDEKGFLGLLGGPAVAHVALPMAQAVGTQDELNARAELADPRALANELNRQRESKFKQAQELKNRQELYAKVAQEDSALSGTGAAIGQAESRIPNWVPGRGTLATVGGVIAGAAGANVQKMEEVNLAIERGERQAAQKPQTPFRVDEGYAPDGRDGFTGANAGAAAQQGAPTAGTTNNYYYDQRTVISNQINSVDPTTALRAVEAR